MTSLIRESLSNVGLEELPKNPDDDLSSYGLDSLMAALLFSELENALGKSLNTDNFTQDSFRSINSIESFINGNSK